MNTAYILVVDDERDIRELIKEILQDEGYKVSTAENGAAAQRARRERRPDLILLDIWMPDIDGISLLKEWANEGGVMSPVIMMSGHATVETAVEATRLGAYDFLEKPLSMAKLLVTVKRALEADKLQRENLGLRAHGVTLEEPIGRSIVMQALREQVKKIAQHEAPVLIAGEAGAGKKLFARYLHNCSPRRHNSFIDVSMAVNHTSHNKGGGDNPNATHPSALNHSALNFFGGEKDGKIHYGQLEQANGGTLFLDEVGDMDSSVQGRLARALRNGSFLRMDGNEPVKLDARIIAATRHDLAVEVQAKRFREDLYYQLNVLPLRIPSLREHCEDVPDLISYYTDIFVRQENLPYRNFSLAAQNRLRNHAWPGNIREIKNLVQRLLILGSDAEVGVAEVETALGDSAERYSPTRTGFAPLASLSPRAFDLPLREARDQFEKAYLEYQLLETGGNISKVAKLAGMERTHLYRKMRALGINVGGVPETLDQ